MDEREVMGAALHARVALAYQVLNTRNHVGVGLRPGLARLPLPTRFVPSPRRLDDPLFAGCVTAVEVVKDAALVTTP